MKQIPRLIGSLLTGAALLLSGCGGGDASGGSVNTSKVESSFSTAEPTLKSSVDAIVSAVKAEDWSAAGAELQKLASNARLTPEQKDSLNGLWEQVKAKLGAAASQAGEAANKAMKDAGTTADKAVQDLGNQLKK